MNRAQILALLLLVLLVGGCSFTGGDDEDPEPTAINVPVDADISSGCWTAENRSLPLSLEGDKQVPQWKQEPEMAIDTEKTYVATVDTNLGSFDITFFPEEAPKTVNNFVCLARAGFYNDTTFHRIVSGFVIQGGDPEGTGRGGPGYNIEDEQVARDYDRGIVAMANTGQPNSGGSQYFVCLQRVQLPPTYTIFGEVTSGMDVVDKIASVETVTPPGGREKSTPVEPVTVSSVTIAES